MPRIYTKGFDQVLIWFCSLFLKRCCKCYSYQLCIFMWFALFCQVDIPVQQSYLWYGSSQGDLDPQVDNLNVQIGITGMGIFLNSDSEVTASISYYLLQASGAYIFRPNGSPPVVVSRSVSDCLPCSFPFSFNPHTNHFWLCDSHHKECFFFPLQKIIIPSHILSKVNNRTVSLLFMFPA